jgi:hypothetical protein
MLARWESSAKDEGIMAKLLGTDCYSQAVRELKRDCRSLGEEDRARLAYNMARCFLARSTNIPPPAPCPNGRKATSCTRSLGDRELAVYLQFYTNVHSVCLFISNQNFLRQAEALTATLYTSSHDALSAIQSVNSGLAAQRKVGGLHRCCLATLRL